MLLKGVMTCFPSSGIDAGKVSTLSVMNVRESGSNAVVGPVKLRPLAPCLTRSSSVRARVSAASSSGAARNWAIASSRARRPRASANGTLLACNVQAASLQNVYEVGMACSGT